MAYCLLFCKVKVKLEPLHDWAVAGEDNSVVMITEINNKQVVVVVILVLPILLVICGY